LTTPEDARHHRLGELLVERRIQLAHSFYERRAFAAATGLNERLLLDVENAKRPRFKAKTKAELEDAYQLARGSIDRFLDGRTDSLEPLPEQDAAEVETVRRLDGEDRPIGRLSPEERAIVLAYRQFRSQEPSGGAQERGA